jgi:hypothetical protein
MTVALPQFSNEAEFRSKWIAPFLSKLGYVLVKQIHGQDEQGKDFFFADYDRMEHRRFYAVQAKVGNIGAAQRDIDALLNQVARCFTVKLRFHKDAHDRHVSSVYIMASGAISHQAREYISDWCDRNAFGENVFFLDGETLDRLDKYAFQRADRQLRNWLIAVRNECQFNASIIMEAHSAFSNKKTIWNRCRHLAVEQLLVNPPPEGIMAIGL